MRKIAIAIMAYVSLAGCATQVTPENAGTVSDYALCGAWRGNMPPPYVEAEIVRRGIDCEKVIEEAIAAQARRHSPADDHFTDSYDAMMRAGRF